ncbi:transposase, partial [Pedobacter frigidisoli]
MAFLYFYGMETALENLSKDDLLKIISARDQIISEHKKVIQDNEKVIQNHEKVIQDHEKIMLNNETAILENHSTISALGEQVDYLKAQVAMYKRMQFGQKRERFEGDPNQAMLPFETPVQMTLLQQEEVKQRIEYVRKRPNHHGRAKLPSHLPVEEIEIHPQGDLTEMVCIGKEITEELECEPARFFIKRYIR